MRDEVGEDDIVHFSWIQATSHTVNKYLDTDILLDTGSTFSVFKNHQMVLNIRKSRRTLKAYTNGGRQDSNRVVDLLGFFTVWFNPNSMINILAFSDVCKKFRITTDTAQGKFMAVHLSPTRLPYFRYG